MRLILDYANEPGKRARTWLDINQVLHVGRIGPADLIVDSDPLMAEIHFAITRFEGCWHIVAFSVECLVSVNGQSVVHHPLQHGDTILAGSTEFRVTIEGAPEIPCESQPIAPQVAAPIIESKPLAFLSKQHPSKIVEFSVSLADQHVPELLNTLAVSGQWYGALNFVRWGRKSPKLTTVGNDLLEKAPEEIRETDSLHIVPMSQPWSTDSFGEIMAACRADSGCLIVSPLELPDLIESHKFVWAWHTRPSILYQQVTFGSRELAEKLFAEIELALTFSRAANSGVKLLTTRAHSDELRNSLEQVRIPYTTPFTPTHGK